MWLKHLSVLNFKNYTESTVTFLPQVNAFAGENGAGKTNLLDAIHYLALCKSYFNPIDSQHIKKGEDWFMVQGEFERDDIPDVVSCSLKKNQKKQFKKNKKDYQRLADHIGQFPLVMISPNDSSIILDGSEERRKFMDNVISQTDNHYLDTLILYNKLLLQRNMLLKQAKQTYVLDLGLLEVLNMQLVDVGEQIFQRRKDFMAEFLPEFSRYYNFLTDGAEEVSLVYESPLMQHDFTTLLEMNLDRDRAMERTTQGVHKDDMLFTIHEEMPLKKFGSQGQQKSFLIALKLAQYSFLRLKRKLKPLLLLDDIFDKLDESRTRKLMQLVSEDEFGQIFLTDTDASRVQRIFDEIVQPIRIFEIKGGSVEV
ncbi:DNA replication/repair protein RecF [Sphingobacterium psychroaquaticum]|uniref:DNA replication and repair protein RecF n=1 Tax=Sphingobacterium psychroaquaticum TaxID=561061 RepID=A0A1X7L8T3_9SPHI|nr:DNA replication and repair protein RecF [Sphingobacterium psychroaquaticum]QBQ42360.1 DNA replication and repair protein RecF [Sphingobacterium psychroaquaticum]SMG49692.1 DNA replication and repair protein RecF [Sphingobacterium psychroaquaticum]